VIKIRKIKRPCDVAGTGKSKNTYTGVWWRNINEREHLEDHSVDGQIILKCISRHLDRIAWPKSGYYEHCNYISGNAITWSVRQLIS
jgi:hypothetical protein